MAYQITQETWLTRAKSRIGSVLTAQMAHGQSYNAAQLIELIYKTFPDDIYTQAELITIRDALVADGVIEIV